MAKLAPRRYSQAIFLLGIETNTLDQMFDEAKFLVETFNNDKEFAQIISYPQISTNEKMSIMEGIFKGKISDNMLGLFNVIFNKNREKETINILNAFIDNVREEKGITLAQIITPFTISSENLNKIISEISKNINKQVEVETKVDPSLIGGLCIKVDGKIIDTSIKKQMNDLKNRLLNQQLAQ